MQNIEQIIKITKDAISESGKPFDKIPQDSILKFLQQNGVKDSNTRISIYRKLQEMYSYQSVKEAKVETTKVTTKSDVPTKEPRKSVFGEVKRIA